MPKRTKLPESKYIGTGKSELTVQKSNPLLTLSETDLTLPEFKILDAYLSRIDSHNEEKRTVQLDKGTLERMLGVSRILKNDLEIRLQHLFQTVKLEDEHKKNGFVLINLFEKAEAEADENGLWTITLTCTEAAREYIFNIDNIGYLRYRLKNVIDLTSRYSYILYLYLENNRFRKEWNVNLVELKEILRCNADTYREYKHFNNLVLKKCQKELQEKTDCHFTYTTVKKGRRVVAIHFSLETLAILEDNIPEQLAFDLPSINDPVEFLRSVSNNVDGKPEWTRIQAEEIYSLVTAIPEDKLPETDTDDIELRRYQFLRQLWLRMQRSEESKPIRNRFNYFLKMLKQEQ